MLPNAGPYINVGKKLRFTHEKRRLMTGQCRVQAGNQPRIRRGEQKKHAAQYHFGDKVGRVGHGLSDALEPPAWAGVDEQSKQQGNREADNQLIQADDQGVADDQPELVGVKKRRKCFIPTHLLPQIPLTAL